MRTGGVMLAQILLCWDKVYCCLSSFKQVELNAFSFTRPKINKFITKKSNPLFQIIGIEMFLKPLIQDIGSGTLKDVRYAKVMIIRHKKIKGGDMC